MRMYLGGFDATPGGFEAWQGLNDMRMNNNWEYGDGTPLGRVFNNWGPQQPDNGQNTGGQPENCATINSETGLWSDAQCTMMMPYVCMIPANQERILIPRLPGQTPFNPGFNPGGNPGFNPGGNPGFNPGGNPGNTPWNPNQPQNPNTPINPNQPGAGRPNQPGRPGQPGNPGTRPI